MISDMTVLHQQPMNGNGNGIPTYQQRVTQVSKKKKQPMTPSRGGIATSRKNTSKKKAFLLPTVECLDNSEVAGVFFN